MGSRRILGKNQTFGEKILPKNSRFQQHIPSFQEVIDKITDFDRRCIVENALALSSVGSRWALCGGDIVADGPGFLEYETVIIMMILKKLGGWYIECRASFGMIHWHTTPHII